MSVFAAIGAFFVITGLAGVALAPRMVDAQKRTGFEFGDPETITDEDRTRVMKGTGVVISLVGFGLILFSLS